MKHNGRSQYRLLFLVMCVLASGCASYIPVPISGLRPQYPEAPMFEEDSLSEPTVKVDSLQPTLRWEAFPGQYAQEIDRGRIRHVTYDLQILRAESEAFYYHPLFLAFYYPAEVVYERHGLTEPVHRVEVPLKPSTRYFWTIRARFELDGQPRATQWGLAWSSRTRNEWGIIPASRLRITANFDRNASRIPRVLNPFYYLFRTPSR